MPKTVILNQQYAPEAASTGQVVRALARELTSLGHVVTVVCGRPFYQDFEGGVKTPSRERIDETQVVRLWNTTFPKKSLPGKLLNQLTFMFSLLWHCLLRIPKDCGVIVTTAPPLAAVCAVLGKRRAGYRLVFSAQDLYPDVLAAAGMVRPASLSYRLLAALMGWAVRGADAVAAISTDMARHLSAVYGVKDAALIPNLTPGAVRMLPHGTGKAARGWEGKLVVQYAGNYGAAHEIETLLGAMTLLRDEPGVVFHIAGGGSHYDLLKAAASGFPNAVFEGYAPLDALEARLALADVSLVVFDSAFRDVLLPSKYYGILASGRAVCLIAGMENDISRDIAAEGVGLVFSPSESVALARALLELQQDPAAVREMGRKARALFEAKYGNAGLAAQYAKLLDGDSGFGIRHSDIGIGGTGVGVGE